jgi:hypothetical protein
MRTLNFSYGAANSEMFFSWVAAPLDEDSTDNTIRSFAFLPLGWDYGNGGPIQKNIIDAAIEWNGFLGTQGFKTDAFPGGGGEIVISASFGDHYLEVISETKVMLTETYNIREKQVIYRLQKSSDEAKKTVLNIAGQIWSASTSFILRNTIRQIKGGLEQLSETTRARSPFSDVAALLAQGQQSANTFMNILEPSLELPATHPFFGNLTQIPSPQEEL